MVKNVAIFFFINFKKYSKKIEGNFWILKNFMEILKKYDFCNI